MDAAVTASVLLAFSAVITSAATESLFFIVDWRIWSPYLLEWKQRKSMMSLILTFIDNFITEGFSSSLASKFCYNQSISILNSLLRFEFRGWQAFKLVKEDIKFWMSHLTTRNNLNPETAEKPVEKPRPLLSTSRCNIILICNKEQWIIVFILS